MSPTIRNARGELEVVDMTPETPVAAPPVLIDRLVPLELELPCGRCLHEPVCGIRETLARTPVQVRQPAAPHPAIRIAIEAVATCDHFLESASRPAAPSQADRRSRPAYRPAHEPRTSLPSARPAIVERPKTVLRNSRSAGDTVARGKDALAALERHSGNQVAAAAELGYRANAFAMVVKHAKAREAREA